MVFFEATAPFVRWLKKRAAGRIIFDCGSGDGDLLRKLLAVKAKAVGIEPFWADCPAFDPRLPVMPTTVQRCSLFHYTTALVVIARPDHSGWASWVFHNARPESEILYIGKPDNLETDTDGWTTEVLDSPQCNEELVYRIDRQHKPAENMVFNMCDCVGVL
jgi:hypothetical protein